jgi:hypothetical protein
MNSDNHKVAAGEKEGGKTNNKLKNSPCSRQFQLLEACGKRNGLLSNSNDTSNNNYEKDRMQACPSETDILIECIHKNPLYFQS